MSTEENKALVRRVNEGIWQGKVALVDEFFAPGAWVGGVASPEELKAFMLDWRKRMPDLSLTIEEMIAEGDEVAFRWTARGTHTHELPGLHGPIPPTGKTVTVTGITIQRIKDGKIVEDRAENNLYQVTHELGETSVASQSPG